VKTASQQVRATAHNGRVRAWKGGIPLVAREPELAVLREALDDASEADPRTVLIAGEAGVGKTRLLDEFESRCRGAELLVARGACVSVGAGELPYSPWIEAMHAIEAEIGIAALIESARGEQATLSALIPVLPDPDSPQQGGQLARAHLFSLFLDLLCRLAAERPLILLLEDLHWADTSSLDLLLFLTRNLRHHPVLLAATFRTDEMNDETHHRAVFTELIRSHSTCYVELQRFDLHEMATLLRATAETDLADTVIRQVHDRSGGNAFLAQELLAAEQRNPGGRLPDHLRDLLMMRAEGLSDEGQQVVGVVAAAGRAVSGDLLEAASGLTPQSLRTGLRDAVSRQVLIRTGSDCYVFRHSLTAETLYEDLLPGERASLHRAVAAALVAVRENGDSPVHHAELAHHWFHGRKYDDALRSALSAARAAVAVHAYAEGGHQYDRVLELWRLLPDPAEICGMPYPRLLYEAAETLDFAGTPRRAVALTREAIQIVGDAAGAADLPASLHEHLARFLWRANDTRGALEASRRCVELLGSTPATALKARAGEMYARALMLSGHYRRAREESDKALAIARSAAARIEEGYLLVTLGTVVFLLGDRDEGVEHLRSGLALAEETDSKENILRAYTNLTYCLQMLNRLDEGIELARRGCARATSFGLRMTTGVVLVGNAADILFDLGRWDEIEQLIGELMQGDVADELPVYIQHVQAELAIARGELSTARIILDAVLRGSAGKTDQDFVGHLYAALAGLEVAAGNWRAARRAVDEGMEKLADGEGLFPALKLCVIGLRAAAEATEAARHDLNPQSAQRWQTWADALAQRIEAIGTVLREAGRGQAPPVTEALTTLAAAEHLRTRGAPAEGAWADTVGAWGALGHPYPQAYARMRYAECLLRRGALTALRRIVAAGLRTARGLGAALLVRDFEALASVAGVPLDQVGGPGTPPTDEVRAADDFGLTRRERQVLDLVAQGYTNGRIARTLTITEKTVSVHVSNILAKLGAANRWEAAMMSQRDPTDGRAEADGPRITT
jgi:DNA-binding CsgD family transcriptional regulator/tetratricopeptide (TPR) repeat protein